MTESLVLVVQTISFWHEEEYNNKNLKVKVSQSGPNPHYLTLGGQQKEGLGGNLACFGEHHHSYLFTLYQEDLIHALGLTISTPGLVCSIFIISFFLTSASAVFMTRWILHCIYLMWHLLVISSCRGNFLLFTFLLKVYSSIYNKYNIQEFSEIQKYKTVLSSLFKSYLTFKSWQKFYEKWNYTGTDSVANFRRAESKIKGIVLLRSNISEKINELHLWKGNFQLEC